MVTKNRQQFLFLSMHNEKKIIQDLLENKTDAFVKVRNLVFPSLKYWIRKNNGTEADAWDVFQESLIVLIAKAQDPDFQLFGSLKGFLGTIQKRIWLKKLEKKQKIKVTPLEKKELVYEDGIDAALIEHENFLLYKKHFNQLSPKCRHILTLFFQKNSFYVIAKTIGFANKDVAKNEKYKCQKKLTQKIKQDPLFKKNQ